MVPDEFTTGATQVLAAFAGLRRTPSSSEPLTMAFCAILRMQPIPA